MKLFDSKNHRTKDGDKFADELARKPVIEVCEKYHDLGASIADMMHIINVDTCYRLAMINAQRNSK